MPSSLPSRTPIANDQVGSLVGEFMEEKRREREEEKARLTPRKRNPFLVPFLIALCAAVWTAPSLLQPEPVLSQETLEQGAKITLYLASIRVRSYLETHRRLPQSLADADLDTTGIVYIRTSDSAFGLSTGVHGSRLVYRSTLPDSVFLGPKLRIRGLR